MLSNMSEKSQSTCLKNHKASMTLLGNQHNKLKKSRRRVRQLSCNRFYKMQLST